MRISILLQHDEHESPPGTPTDDLFQVILGLSRTTLALAAVNFGVRVLPDWWSLDLTNSAAGTPGVGPWVIPG